MEPVILHCDCNAFFASVEELYHPEYKDVPMAVCGDPESRHGIILAKNEKAKAYGIQTAETIWSAKQKCPSLLLAPARRDAYKQCFKQINTIYTQYTDQVEPFSIDESFLDITGSLHLFKKDGPALANEIRQRIEKEVGITISVGVSFCKIFAKMGSDYKKPNATTVITQENFKQILWPLPAGTMMMVGPRLVEQLKSMSIFTLGDLANADLQLLISRFGKHGQVLYDYANGRDCSPVLPYGTYTAAKSIGNGRTFRRDLMEDKDAFVALRSLTETVVNRMRNEQVLCSQVQITVRYATMKTFTRQITLSSPTNLVNEITSAAYQLLLSHWNKQPIRMLTVTAGGLCPEEEDAVEQVSFFDTDTDSREKNTRLEEALFRIRDKYGKESIEICAVRDKKDHLF